MKRLFIHFPFLSALACFLISCEGTSETVDVKPDQPIDETKHEIITLGGGCYWCVEAVFQQLPGVASATSGFMGGHIPDPTYRQVSEGSTGHVEVVQVVYDPKIISTQKIIEWFWKSHDPTNPLGQGIDEGPMYMSHIFVHSDRQRQAAETSKESIEGNYDNPIVTEIKEAKEFYAAGEKDQDYYFRMKGKNPYCPQQITPKLKKLGLTY
ncbi:MAG: peptide-methionine (S)-S-oxide reductase MsrA [Akkermansiaceae bacterium]|jgi:peptide-methionine (S)-S-oxide reductase|tara:strand:- start:749 stop:1378 length:630 start_codon:yes stop_codon:yes gene_type:complete